MAHTEKRTQWVPRTVVIGDVHGCIDELQDLLRAVGFDEGAGDRAVLVGDLVGKGPDSQGVVQLCRERGLRAVLGNHDAHLLGIRQGAPSRKPPKQTHLEAAAAMREEDWAYLERLPLFLRLDREAEGFIVVHGGLVPGVPLEAQQREDCLNLRSIREDGTGSARIEDGPAWASLWPGPEHVVFGHDAVRGLQQHAHATGLDSGCVYGRALTALVLPERRLMQVPARRAWVPSD